MPSYHSIFNAIQTVETKCDIPLLVFKRGKPPTLDPVGWEDNFDKIELDIIDEAIIYFRVNILFKNFLIKGKADKLLVYITVFIQKCLETAHVNTAKSQDCKAPIKALVEGCEYIPSVENFFNVLTTCKDTPGEIPGLQKYLRDVRKETSERLIQLLFNNPQTMMDLKYWLGWGKNKFMWYEMISKK